MRRRVASLLVVVWFSSACLPKFPAECITHADCAPGRCVNGACTPPTSEALDASVVGHGDGGPTLDRDAEGSAGDVPQTTDGDLVRDGAAPGDGGEDAGRVDGLDGSISLMDADPAVPDAGVPDPGDAGSDQQMDVGPPGPSDAASEEDLDAEPAPDAEVPDSGLAFPYMPSNFTPRTPTSVTGELRVEGECRVNTDSMSFLGAGCAAVPSGGDIETLGPSVAGLPGPLLLHVRTVAISLVGRLAAEGSRPLLIAVYEDGDVSGAVDVSAFGGTPGPGGSHGACGLSAGQPGVDAAGTAAGSGGGGGGLATPGASGGGGAAVGSGQDTPEGRGGGGPIALLANGIPAALFGGCPGGRGGDCGLSIPGGGASGAGGGGIQISVAGTLTVSGSIRAAGGGGGAGANRACSGGGGGGSGGAILLEASVLTLAGSAQVSAHGAGGGGGSTFGAGLASDGMDAPSCCGGSGGGGSAPTSFARGGNGGHGGGRGFPNLAPEPGSSGTASASDPGGGGGGGGSEGLIVLFARTSCARAPGALVSPTAQLLNLASAPCM